jgi:hypothetical protein
VVASNQDGFIEHQGLNNFQARAGDVQNTPDVNGQPLNQDATTHDTFSPDLTQGTQPLYVSNDLGLGPQTGPQTGQQTGQQRNETYEPASVNDLTTDQRVAFEQYGGSFEDAKAHFQQNTVPVQATAQVSNTPQYDSVSLTRNEPQDYQSNNKTENFVDLNQRTTEGEQNTQQTAPEGE